MGIWLRRLGMLVLVLVVGVAGVFGVAYWRSEAAIAKTYAIDDAPLPLADADLARGEHLYVSRGCSDCHGKDGAGTLDISAGPVFRAVGANISPTGLGGRYDAAKLAAAIRHGVRADGTTLIFMPSYDYSELSDRDTADLVAYTLQLPPAGEPREASELRPLGRLLWLLGKADELLPAGMIDHRPRDRSAPEAIASAAYGAYLVAVCQGCHRPDLMGGMELEPGKPKSSNINGARGGLQGWTQADFVRAMREGRRPDGRAIDEVMPWRTLGTMTDTELEALWAYLQAPSG